MFYYTADSHNPEHQNVNGARTISRSILCYVQVVSDTPSKDFYRLSKANVKIFGVGVQHQELQCAYVPTHLYAPFLNHIGRHG